jgi:hypothetical protein
MAKPPPFVVGAKKTPAGTTVAAGRKMPSGMNQGLKQKGFSKGGKVGKK